MGAVFTYMFFGLMSWIAIQQAHNTLRSLGYHAPVWTIPLLLAVLMALLFLLPSQSQALVDVFSAANAQ